MAANMDYPQMQDLERLFLLEQTRKIAEANYSKNPFDAENLTRLGMVLLELSQFIGDPLESKRMIKGAISKLQEALDLDPRKPEVLWYLGNALTTEGFLTRDLAVALGCFEKASQCFKKAVDEAPENEMYLKSLETATKAPIMYMELQQGIGQQTQKLESSTSPEVNFAFSKVDWYERANKSKLTATLAAWSSNNKKSNDLKSDICGWILLGAGILAMIAMKVQAPPPIG